MNTLPRKSAVRQFPHRAERIAVLILVLAHAAPLHAGETITGRASVIDGDTIEIHGQRIRLWGIDAPESRQSCYAVGKPWRCGQKSALALSDHFGARTVVCVERDRDRYRRIVATCSVGGEDVAAWLVRNGWALDWPRYSNEAYAVVQEAARQGKSGVWWGEFKKPWEWRRKKTESSE